MTHFRSIGILTSGGDSPGMNAAIRAVVRTALGKGLKVQGIRRGYKGLLEGDIRKMALSSVGNILQRGGTILQTSRCPEFKESKTRERAARILREHQIDALVVIGGDGSFNGAYLLAKEHSVPIVGLPGTIDNDISGTSYTIGFDTAVQTAVEAVDRIRDTAFSHERTFIVEVMGRNSPALALHVGVCTGAENIIFPGQEVDYRGLVSDIRRGMKRGKKSSIIVVAEGYRPGLSYEIQKTLKDQHELEAHVCILGHTQRGGCPSPTDRFMASRMGYLAVLALLEKKSPTVTAYNQGTIELVPLEKCLTKKATYDDSYIELAKALSI